MLKVRAVRLAQQKTQWYVAHRADMHPSDLSRIENGHAKPYPRQAEKLARALNLQPSELLEESTLTLTVEPSAATPSPGSSRGATASTRGRR